MTSTIDNLFARLGHKSHDDISGGQWSAGFDPEFYSEYYKDLRSLKSADALLRHYLLHGYREGRWKNPVEARRSLEARFGVLPEDFDVDGYRRRNRDLAAIFDCDWQFTFHYLEHGCREGRNYNDKAGPRRLEKLTFGTNPNDQKGLEFGALDKPVLGPERGDIRFVDYASRDALRAYPHAATIDKDRIVAVDYVWSGSGSLAKVIGTGELFDYAIASHVIEHVPNIVGWFEGIAEVLKPGGVFNLAIPDKRFTFDARRNLSTLGELVEAHLSNFTYPSIRQMFDHCFEAVAIDPGARWDKDLDVGRIPRYLGDVALQLAYDQAVKVVETQHYYDSHCLVVTPESFLTLLDGLSRLHIFPLVLSEFYPTVAGDMEFFCHFVKPAETDAVALEKRQLACLEAHKRKCVFAAAS